jgi:hypothetical protein
MHAGRPYSIAALRSVALLKSGLRPPRNMAVAKKRAGLCHGQKSENVMGAVLRCTSPFHFICLFSVEEFSWRATSRKARPSVVLLRLSHMFCMLMRTSINNGDSYFGHMQLHCSKRRFVGRLEKQKQCFALVLQLALQRGRPYEAGIYYRGASLGYSFNNRIPSLSWLRCLA